MQTRWIKYKDRIFALDKITCVKFSPAQPDPVRPGVTMDASLLIYGIGGESPFHKLTLLLQGAEAE